MLRKTLSILLLVFCLSADAQDYLQLKSYTLDNGFKVYLLPDPYATTTFGAVAVHAGSKNDPADATGLAHYLEHLLFKGTTTMGTIDYEKEKPFLDSITFLYQELKKTSDETQRKAIKIKINQQAMEAGKYGLPTEFHTLLSSIGGTAINAFTAPDMTVYHNSFPGEQMEKWLELYSHRFINPVFRSFQSELEVVYEEKNRASDNFQFKLITELQKSLYPTHPYGTQTSLGSTEHLKNPPIDRIYEFFKNYYVANNMALFLVGNFNADAAIPLIKEKFGKLPSGNVPTFVAPTPYVFSKNVVTKLRVTPVKVDLVGFKSIPTSHPDEVALELCNSLLFNDNETGLLNKLQQNGKLLAAFAQSFHLNDDGAELLIIVPKIVGESFGKAEKLVFAQLDSIINGNFSDAFLENSKNELIRNYKQNMEDPENRGLEMIDMFTTQKTWNDVLAYPEKLSKLTKADVMAVAKKYYARPHYSLQSKTGFPKKDQLEKPGFKPAVTTQTEKSKFAKEFEEIKDATVTPRFLDLNAGFGFHDLGNGSSFYSLPNRYNNIASLNINYYAGTHLIPNLSLAAQLLNECYPKGMTLESFKSELAKINTTLEFTAEDDFFSVSIIGDEKNMERAMELCSALLNAPEAAKEAMKNLTEGMKADQESEQKDPATMGLVLRSYALYGNESPYKKRASLSEVKSWNASKLLQLINEAKSYSASFHYCGNADVQQLIEAAKKNQLAGNKGKAVLTELNNQPIEKTKIYLVNNSKSRQNQIYFSALGSTYNSADDAKLSLLGQYLGGSFSGLILQEIREYRSLAYTAGGRFTKPILASKPILFTSFVGCQADKTNESIDVMLNILNKMPEYPARIPAFKNYITSSLTTSYPNQRDLTETVELLKLKGFNKDPKLNEYESIKDLSFEKMLAYYEANLKSKPLLITIYGDKSKIDLLKLKSLGEIIELKEKDIATY